MNDQLEPIPYESQPTTGPVSVVPDRDSLRIGLRPMSTWTFAAAIFPSLLWLGVSAGVAGLMIMSRNSFACLWIAVGLVFLISVTTVGNGFRRRGVTRFLWASPYRLGYLDCGTSEAPRFTRYRQTLTPAIVQRSWWRPWVCHLTVRPVIRPFTIGRSDPIVLAVDGDRAMLESLIPVIEAARVETNNAHIRGAFEVLPVRRPEQTTWRNS